MKIVRRSFLSIPVAILLTSLPVLVLMCVEPSSTYILEIVDAGNGHRLFWTQVWPGDRFSLEYLHSVHLSRVTDVFEIDRHYGIILVDTVFSDHGAGLPDGAHSGGKFSIWEDGRFHVSGMNTVLPEILLRTGREYDNAFECESRRINLSRRCGDALLAIRTRRYSILRRLLRRLLNVG